MTMSLLRHNNITTGSNVSRDVSWGDCGRLAVTARMWRAAVDCSRHEPQQPEKLGHRLLITAYDGWLAMTTRRNVVDIVPRNPPAHEVRQCSLRLPAEGWPGWVDEGGRFNRKMAYQSFITNPSQLSVTVMMGQSYNQSKGKFCSVQSLLNTIHPAFPGSTTVVALTLK